MQEMIINLPETVKEYVESRIASGDYLTSEEYLVHLIREDQKRRAKEYLKMKIREAEESGPPEEITAEYWDDVRRTFHQKNGQEQSS
jgi:antitoxin ParD1/3/4